MNFKLSCPTFQAHTKRKQLFCFNRIISDNFIAQEELSSSLPRRFSQSRQLRHIVSAFEKNKPISYVSDVPETRLVGIPTTDVEELKDTVAVRCVVNGNPRASVTWRREGQSVAASFQELLQFSPVVRQHAGLYTCHARNPAGESPPLRFHLDVKCKFFFLRFFFKF